MIKLDFNNDIHVLPQKVSTLSDLKKYICNLYLDLKKNEFFHLQYKDKDDFAMNIQTEQEFSQALQYLSDQKLASLKLKIILDNQNVSLFNQEKPFCIRTPSTANEANPQKNRFIFFDNSNTTSSDEKFTGRESLFVSEMQDKIEKEKTVRIMEGPFSFIRVEEEKNICESKQKISDIREPAQRRRKSKEEIILNENAFNGIDKFFKVKCYKCKGNGFHQKKPEKKCKKCNGTGVFTNSKKIMVIDHLIKGKLNNIYKEYETKGPASPPIMNQFFASETIHNSNAPFGLCSFCAISIEDGVKYKCPKCPLLTFCGKCEENVSHNHALIKLRKNVEENKMNFSKSVQLSYPFSLSEQSSLAKSIKKQPLDASTKLSSSTNSCYKAKFLTDHLVEKVALGAEYSLSFTIKNNGDGKWPENMEFICLSGYYQSFSVKVPPINPNDKHTVKFNLRAPKNEETVNSSWRLGYSSKNEKKYFGPKINSTITAVRPEIIQKDLKKNFMSH